MIFGGGQWKSLIGLQLLADKNFSLQLLVVLPPHWPFDRGRRSGLKGNVLMIKICDNAFLLLGLDFGEAREQFS